MHCSLYQGHFYWLIYLMDGHIIWIYPGREPWYFWLFKKKKIKQWLMQYITIDKIFWTSVLKVYDLNLLHQQAVRQSQNILQGYVILIHLWAFKELLRNLMELQSHDHGTFSTIGTINNGIKSGIQPNWLVFFWIACYLANSRKTIETLFFHMHPPFP